jgi:hypothetical protein
MLQQLDVRGVARQCDSRVMECLSNCVWLSELWFAPQLLFAHTRLVTQAKQQCASVAMDGWRNQRRHNLLRLLDTTLWRPATTRHRPASRAALPITSPARCCSSCSCSRRVCAGC